MSSDCGNATQRRRGKINWHSLHSGQMGKELNQKLESDQKPNSTEFHNFGTVFQHLGACWVENEQSNFSLCMSSKSSRQVSAFRNKCRKYQQCIVTSLLPDTRKSRRVISCHRQKAEDIESVTEGQAEQTQSKLLPTDYIHVTVFYPHFALLRHLEIRARNQSHDTRPLKT